MQESVGSFLRYNFRPPISYILPQTPSLTFLAWILWKSHPALLFYDPFILRLKLHSFITSYKSFSLHVP